MSMDLFVQKKSLLLTLTLAAGCWLAGCSANVAAPPPGNPAAGNGNGGGGGGGGVGPNAGNTSYIVGSGGNGGSTNTSTGQCAGTSKCFAPVDAGPYCGDGILRTDLGEECDDNNRIGGDGCSGICKTEPNWKCDNPGQPCVSLIVCGNGLRQTGEGCDDGNTAAGDGCDGKCNAESGFYCVPTDTNDPASKSSCKALASCGDGKITAGENCDLGSGNGPGTGCDKCQTEEGWVCRPGVGCRHQSVCGNSKVEDGELCDDGNDTPDDGCSSSCQKEASYYECPTPGAPCVDSSSCGNGILEKTELCDDGNSENGDGCTSGCEIETGYQCRMAGKACVPVCGDGKMVGGETCDDGNKDNDDGCSKTCLIEPGYTCTKTLPSKCTESICGDGTKDDNERCDSGKDNGLFFGDGSGCSKTCTQEPVCARGTAAGCAEVCGDGNKSANEKCDDGNVVPGDGCSETCTIEEGFDCKDVTLSDEEPCPSKPSLKCLVLPVIYRDFEGQQVNGGHPDFFYYGASASGGRKTGVTTGASKTTCVPNAMGTQTAWADGEACNSDDDQTGPCLGLVANNLDSAGKPVMAKDTCHCVFTDWDRTGLLGTCPTSGTGDCTIDTTIPGVKQCWVQDEGSQRLRIEGDVKMFQSAQSFEQWYRDSDYSTNIHGLLELASISATQYQFSSSIPGDPAGTEGRTTDDDLHDICLASNHTGTLESGFFPIEDAGGQKVCNIWPYWISGMTSASKCCAGTGCPVMSQWDKAASYDNCPTAGTGGPVPSSGGTGGKVNGVMRNFYMTTEVRYLFRYSGAAGTLAFFGDDDVWVFINGILALDLGGTHKQLQKSVQINATTYKLTSGNTYEIAVFHADRNPRDSNYQLTLSGFSTVLTQCQPTCGDGNVTGGEECDKPDGKPNDGSYGGCNPDCTYADFCGDGVPNGEEECDDGKNTTVTSTGVSSDACGPGCHLPPRCGDEIIQTGEECDDGSGNANDQCGGCNEECKKNPFCGDAIVQASCDETCDDGVNMGGYGYCLADCTPDAKCGDGVTQTEFGETCDKGDQNSDAAGSACNLRCGIPAVCGDGSVQSPEQCDYGAENNTGAYGGCNVDCTLAAYCGDGAKNGTEECDYGPANIPRGQPAPYGSCLDSCTLGPHCGDGEKQDPPEQCDLGSLNGPNNQCSDKCIVQGGIT